jgi:hypothetical protein
VFRTGRIGGDERQIDPVSSADERSHLARSATSFKRCKRQTILAQIDSGVGEKLSAIQLMMRSSKSSPPRNVFPEVESTSNTPSFISRIEISKRAAAKIVNGDAFDVRLCPDHKPAPPLSAR